MFANDGVHLSQLGNSFFSIQFAVNYVWDNHAVLICFSELVRPRNVVPLLLLWRWSHVVPKF
jgi:hypothetical protein